MASPDLVPSPRQAMIRGFGRIMKLMALLAIAIAVIAVVLEMRGQHDAPIQMLIAVALGIGLVALLGTGLMSLAFLSSSSGHDEQVSANAKDKE